MEIERGDDALKGVMTWWLRRGWSFTSLHVSPLAADWHPHGRQGLGDAAPFGNVNFGNVFGNVNFGCSAALIEAAAVSVTAGCM